MVGVYKPRELFKDNGDVVDEIKTPNPEDPDRRLGQKEEVHGAYRSLKPIDWRKFTVKKGTSKSSMQTVGEFLEQIVKNNPKTVRIFSPDEFESNKLDEILNSTNRNFHGINLQCAGRRPDRGAIRASMSRLDAGLHFDRPSCFVS